MDPTAWTLYLLIAAALAAGAVFHYRRREPVGRGRGLLAGLRGAVLALLVLLLFAPTVPAGPGARAPTVALVDGSLSMRLPDPAGERRWDEAVRAVAELRPDRVLVYGHEARRVAGLHEAGPTAPGGRLGPALRAALEGGAGRVVVVTDGAIEDPADAARLAAGASLPVEVRRVGATTAGNVGLSELELPRWARVGEEVRARVAVSRIGDGVPDSVTIRLRRGATELASTRLATPPEGRLTLGELRFTPRGGSPEPVRLDATLEVSDAEPADDQRSGYMLITDEAAGVTLVSFRPDQEPRFLLPVLERALGVPTRGWMAMADGRYVRLGLGAEAGRVDGEAVVRRAVEGADLVVLHGVDAASPEWARRAATGARRALLLPGPGDPVVPFGPGPRRPGDWYPVAEVPASPVAPLLAGADAAGAPPLTGLRPAMPPAGAWAPLRARLDRRGEPWPLVVVGEVNGRRVAVAMADGFWRWAFDAGPGRRMYESLWGGVGGWLMEGSGAPGEPAIRPVARSAPRGVPVRWAVPAGTDSVRIALQPAEGPVAEPVGATAPPAPLDTVVTATDGVAVTPPPRPGHYRYEARAYLATTTETAAGALTVESWSREFTRPASPLALDEGGAARGGAVARVGRPLHATPWPYLALVALLCAEWVLRRRWGLR